VIARVMASGLAAGLVASAAPEPPVFRAGVESVYVDVFVSKGGRPVAGLVAADFELKDDGAVQQVELVAAEARPVQGVLVFDTSSSMMGPKLKALRAAGGAFLDGLRPMDEAGLLAYSHEIAWLAPPSADKEPVRASLGRLRAAGATAAFDALYAALTLSDSTGRSLLVMFTDGEDNNVSILAGKQVREVARRSNVLVHVVGLRPAEGGESETARVLREVAEESGGKFWSAASTDRLRAAFGAIAAAMAERYVLRYEPRGPARAGWHPLAVRLKGKGGVVTARRGYWVAAW
jgi:VWFA-related protein